MSGVLRAARRTDGFVCVASSALGTLPVGRFGRVRSKAPVRCRSRSSDRTQARATSTISLHSSEPVAARRTGIRLAIKHASLPPGSQPHLPFRCGHAIQRPGDSDVAGVLGTGDDRCGGLKVCLTGNRI